ncbi:glycosyltransferase [Patescibacteria group bacterium]|nr:glycosyltransferase [Patescibacteria group bacterium]
MQQPKISLIIPVRNERDNLETLFLRIHTTLQKAGIPYEAIVVDDYSTDGSTELLIELLRQYPIRLVPKQGKMGKGYSLVEGLRYATSETVGFIDADLSYPPEAIPGMIKELESCDIVVAERTERGPERKTKARLGKIFRAVFGKALFGLNHDVQAGLKIFKKETAATLKLHPGKWSFDLEFLYKAMHAGAKIRSYPITYGPRLKGKRKLNLATAGLELGLMALRSRLSQLQPVNFPSLDMKGARVGWKKKRFTTHTNLPHHQSALQTLKASQKIAFLLLLTLLIAGVALNLKTTAIAVIAILSTIYFLDAAFSFFVLLKTLHFPPEIKITESETGNIDEKNLPIYTILSPLYREAKILHHFLQSLERIDWPKEKLDVLLLLEEDDKETREALEKIILPSYIRTITVPHTYPKTKPKACNYGLTLAKGEYVVIYDAEDRPDPLQLKKAYLAFQKSDPKIICLQSKLNYYNPHHNLLTRLFTAEYSLWFDVVLPGLQSIETSIPLGGTSNHFRTKDLRGLHAWDPFNVTEDCDLGVRLFKEGFKTALINSTTLEEANSSVSNWLRQRSRWIKGYMQTYLVHMRDPLGFFRSHGVHALIFQLVIGMRITFTLINPILWVATISYFALYGLVGPTIEALYPTPVFYMAVLSLVFGNFMYLYNYMIGCAKRGHWSIIKYVFLIPFYWLMVSSAAAIAVYQLATKPHFWEKTHHGLHIQKLEAQRAGALRWAQKRAARAKRLQRLRRLTTSGIATGGTLVAASVVANFFNFLYNAYLGRTVSIEEFGIISVFTNILYIAQASFGALSETVTHQAAYLLGKYNITVKEFWSFMRRKALNIALIVSGLWLALTPALTVFFKTDSILPFLLFTPVWLIGILTAVDRGFLAGNLKFVSLAAVIAVGAITKFVIASGLVTLGYVQWVYASIPASMSVALLIAWWTTKRLKGKKLSDTKVQRYFPWRFFATSALTGLATITFLSLDVILVKHYLSPVEAGQYALLSLPGKMIFFAGGLFGRFVNPLVSKAVGAGKGASKIFYRLLALKTAVSAAGFVAVGLFGYLTVPFLFGPKAQAIVPLLPMYALGMMCFTIASSFVTYHQVKKEYLFPIVSFLLAAIQVIGIAAFHANLLAVTTVMAVVGVYALLIMVLLHLTYERLAAPLRNLLDFFGLFAWGYKPQPTQKGKMRILVFNWRDTKHIWAGGAELYIQELAKRWVSKGHKVTLFCGNDGKSKRNQVVDGVQVVRRGGFYTVYIWAFLYYIFRFRGRFDLVVDCENGIPFFTPLYARLPNYLVIHHVHQEVFRERLRAPFSWLAIFLESKLMPLVYRKSRVVTISQSSKKAIVRLGLTEKTPAVIHSGVDLTSYVPGKKAKEPLVVYVGRLKPYKNLPVLINAIRNLANRLVPVKLVIAGFGEERERLEQLVQKLGLESYVTFAGRVSEAKKIELYQKAWVAVNPSSMEGWGITSIEANACGTPVVASDVPGLRDSVKNPHSGFLVNYQDPSAFADRIFRIITNKRLREDLSGNARTWASQFKWDKSAERFLSLFEESQSLNLKH